VAGSGVDVQCLGVLRGRGVAQRAVRREVVVFDAPALDQHAGLAQAAEELAVQELAPQSLFRGSVIGTSLNTITYAPRSKIRAKSDQRRDFRSATFFVVVIILSANFFS
jgi:hypothetical protein